METTLKRFLPLCTTALLLSVCFASLSAANETMDEAERWADISEEINEAPVYEDDKAKSRKWTLKIGLSGGVSPDYEGSNDYGFGFGPNINRGIFEAHARGIITSSTVSLDKR